MFHDQMRLVRLTHLNARREKAGKENVPVVDLSLSMEATPDDLAALNVDVSGIRQSCTVSKLPEMPGHDVLFFLDGDEEHTFAAMGAKLKKLSLEVDFTPSPEPKAPAAPEPQMELPVEGDATEATAAEPAEVEPAAPPEHACTLTFQVAVRTDEDFPYWRAHEAVDSEITIGVMDRKLLATAVVALLDEWPVAKVFGIDRHETVRIRDHESVLRRRTLEEREPGEAIDVAFHRIIADMQSTAAAPEATRAEKSDVRQDKLEQLRRYDHGSAPWLNVRLSIDLEDAGCAADASVERVRTETRQVLETGESDSFVIARKVGHALYGLPEETETGPGPCLAALLVIAQQELATRALPEGHWMLLPGKAFSIETCMAAAKDVFTAALGPEERRRDAGSTVRKTIKDLTGQRGSVPMHDEFHRAVLASVDEWTAEWKAARETPAAPETEAAPAA